MVASPLGEAQLFGPQLPELEMVMSFGAETGDDDWIKKKQHETMRIDDGLFSKFTLFVLIL